MSKGQDTVADTYLRALSDQGDVSDATLPTMIAVAEYENPLIDVHCAELLHALARHRRRAPRFVWLENHNHTSIIAHFNTAEDDLGRHILAFMKRPF